MNIAIIGSGISGMMTAWMLAGRGCDITLYDKQQPGQESSWAGGGIVSPLYPWRYADSVTRLAKASQAVYPKLAETLKSESGIDPEYLRSGLLIFSPEEEEAAQEWGRRWSMDIRSVDASAIADLDPALACPDPTALWFPDVGQVRNPRIVKALYSALKKRPGTRFIINAEVSSLSPSPHGIEVETGSSRETFDKAILCTGAWSPLLLEHAGIQPEIRPVRGQMLLFRTEPDTVRRITLHENHYAIPRKDGRVLFGSTIENTGFVKETTEAARSELATLAAKLYPVLADAPIEHHWAGLRPGSPEGIPYIGPVPGINNLFINAGHFRNGVVLAPASAKLAADLLTGEAPDIDPAPYTLDAKRKREHHTAPETPV
jgi:glycine oxidase